MNQIVIVGAGHHFPKGPFAFLRAMQQNERIHAKGLFFQPIDYAALEAVYAGASDVPVMELVDNEKELIAHHKDLFRQQCGQYHIPCSLHDNDREWNKEVFIRESRFADLILISGEFFYAEMGYRQPNQYLREALHHAECPVILVPESFTAIDHLFMAYDGGCESLHAIKQFCYLFPDLLDLPTEVVYIRQESSDDIPELENLKQYTQVKFNCMSFSKLHFNAAGYFSTWISEKKNVLLVSGSFGRSPLSYIGKRSFAEEVIHDHRVPVFIAHR